MVEISVNNSFREIHQNLAVEVRSVFQSTLLSGLGFTSASNSSEEFGASSLVVVKGDDMNRAQEKSDVDSPNAILMLPPEVQILAKGKFSNFCFVEIAEF